MKYNFDEIIDRKNTSCIKWDYAKEFLGEGDLLPMWVADMDFKTPDFIVDAVKERAQHEIYGYSMRPAGYYQSIVDWMKNRHQWEIEKDWIVYSPGIVPAINLAVLAFTQPEDEIIIQPPVYFPFYSAVKDHGRNLVLNQLKFENGVYTFDFEDLKQKITPKTKLLIISNPHNPVGRSWNETELQTLADICIRQRILIISDEIHSDLVLKPNRHHVLAKISKEIADRTLTMMAPSKTFNLAGMSTSSVIISNPEVRETFKKMIDKMHLGLGNIFGSVASEAAYSKGSEWLDQMLDYVKENVIYVTNYLESNFPKIKMINAEATYMVWLDFRELNLSGEEVNNLLLRKAKLGLSDGKIFGQGGEGFQRMNLACPRSYVESAMKQLKTTIDQLS
jgi:cysteine-S-conjugate beta-lyase